MKFRRHHNNKGTRQIKRGKTRLLAVKLKKRYCTKVTTPLKAMLPD